MIELDNDKKMLLTGSNGFIGRHFVDYLNINEIPYRVIKHQLFNDEEKLSEAILSSDVIIHLAALTRGSYDELHDANFGNTENLFKAVLQVKGKKPVFIFASSFAVYGIQDQILTEDSLLEPRNDYGKSKLEVEDLVRKYSDEFGITSLILRFSNVYGLGVEPYTHSVIATFIDQALNKKPFTINGDGTQMRDFVYVEDVVKALWMAIFEGLINDDGKTIVANICSGQGVSMNELISKIGLMVGVKPIVQYINKDIPEPGYWVGDNSLALKTFGWKPETDLDEGLKKSY
jgi:UDP-glucose 4-epimerase